MNEPNKNDLTEIETEDKPGMHELPPEDSGYNAGSDPGNLPQGSGEDRLYRGLKQRLITALIVAVVYVAGFMLGTYVSRLFYDFMILLIMGVATFEMCRAVGIRFAKPLTVVALCNIALVFAVFMVVTHAIGKGQGGVTSSFGMLAVMFIVSIVICMASKTYTMNNVVSTMFVMIYPSVFLVYLLSVAYLGNPSAANLEGAFTSRSVIAVAMLFGGCAMSDGGAYFVGSAVKGPKLCPAISPKKTISGAIGGLVCGIITGMVYLLFANFGILRFARLSPNNGLNFLYFFILGIGTSLFCQVGDLVSSYIKRACGTKDFGRLLKGHGGIMDRIDGVILAGVFIYAFMFLLDFIG